MRRKAFFGTITLSTAPETPHLPGKLFADGLQDWQALINELLTGKKPG
jgi:hypothetical protein